MLNIEIIPCLNDNYSYLLYDEDTNAVAIIDPSDFNPCDKIINEKYNKLDYILNTHHHFDHVGGNQKLKEKYKSKVLGFQLDKNRIPGIDIALKEKQSFKIGNTSFEVIFIPGHTKGHVAFYCKDEKIVFTGDTLFSLGCGRVFEGTYEEMHNSLKKINKLEDDVTVYCGHEYTKTNLKFLKSIFGNENEITNLENKINTEIQNSGRSIPFNLGIEKKTNPDIQNMSNEILKKNKFANIWKWQEFPFK